MNPNGTQAGELTTASCQLPDGSSVYAFRVVIPVRGTLQLTPKGTGFTPSLIIRDADGHKVEAGATISALHGMRRIYGLGQRQRFGQVHSGQHFYTGTKRLMYQLRHVGRGPRRFGNARGDQL